MFESLIHSLLLALHNVALVGCAAAPFYNLNLVRRRSQFGPTLDYRLDKVVEETLQGTEPYCIAFMTTLWVTGIAMPLNHVLFHGAMRPMHAVALAALIVKIAAILAMLVVMLRVLLKFNPRLRVIFASFSPDTRPEKAVEAEFFAVRAKRRQHCVVCFYLSLVVLVSSAFLGFGTV
ncbi:MAG: hypothetical protein FJY67_09945 [Calditrichaeota bacterium]|nr:hypothetical protein [Calditrichota bacterium]